MFTSVSARTRRLAPALLGLAVAIAGIGLVGAPPASAAANKVTGKVVSASGAAVQGVTVQWVRIDCATRADAAPASAGSVVTNVQGDFEFASAAGRCFRIALALVVPADTTLNEQLTFTYQGARGSTAYILSAADGSASPNLRVDRVPTQSSKLNITGSDSTLWKANAAVRTVTQYRWDASAAAWITGKTRQTTREASSGAHSVTFRTAPNEIYTYKLSGGGEVPSAGEKFYAQYIGGGLERPLATTSGAVIRSTGGVGDAPTINVTMRAYGTTTVQLPTDAGGSKLNYYRWAPGTSAVGGSWVSAAANADVSSNGTSEVSTIPGYKYTVALLRKSDSDYYFQTLGGWMIRPVPTAAGSSFSSPAAGGTARVNFNANKAKQLSITLTSATTLSVNAINLITGESITGTTNAATNNLTVWGAQPGPTFISVAGTGRTGAVSALYAESLNTNVTAGSGAVQFTSAGGASPSATVPTVGITVSGNMSVGGLLSTRATVPADDRGVAGALRYAYYWSNGTQLLGTGSTLRVPASQAGRDDLRLSVVVSSANRKSRVISIDQSAFSPITGNGADTLQSTAAPVLKGVAAVGRSLEVTAGGWSRTPTALRYQWRVNGAPVAGATGRTFSLSAAHRGKQISVTVTPVLGSVAGQAITVAAASTVSKATSRVRVKIAKKVKKRAKFAVTVSAPALSRLSGKVSLHVAGKTVKGSLRKGKATLRLPKGVKGSQTFVVSYSGSAGATKSTSAPVSVTIK